MVVVINRLYARHLRADLFYCQARLRAAHTHRLLFEDLRIQRSIDRKTLNLDLEKFHICPESQNTRDESTADSVSKLVKIVLQLATDSRFGQFLCKYCQVLRQNFPVSSVQCRSPEILL